MLTAHAVFMDAFSTDVRPALAEWREGRGLPADPMAAYAASGYGQRIAEERVGGVQAGWGPERIAPRDPSAARRVLLSDEGVVIDRERLRLRVIPGRARAGESPGSLDGGALATASSIPGTSTGMSKTCAAIRPTAGFRAAPRSAAPGWRPPRTV